MRAKIDTLIEFDFSCNNGDVDKEYLRNDSTEYAQMLKDELESFIRDEINDDKLTITNIETEIEYIEDIPKENK